MIKQYLSTGQEEDKCWSIIISQQTRKGPRQLHDHEFSQSGGVDVCYSLNGTLGELVARSPFENKLKTRQAKYRSDL